MKYDVRDNFKEIQDIPCILKIGNPELFPMPELSVVVPTYKRPDLLKQTIDSITAQENFECPYEIIVVDNDDSEIANETEKLLRSMELPNLLYYKNATNVGAVGNWNRCIMLARSNWIIMCHDDDLLKNDCLSTMHQIIKIHENDKLPLGYVRSSAESFYEVGINPNERREARIKKRKTALIKKRKTALIKRGYRDVIWGGGATWAGAPTCGTLINKKAAIEMGGYNELHSPCPDCYLPYHMLGKYGVYKTYYPFGKYRWGQNDTYNKGTLLGLIAAYEEFLKILAPKEWIVRFFENEHYADCVQYYESKGKEAGVVISDEEIFKIRPINYSNTKLKVLRSLRRFSNGISTCLAK